MIEIGASPSATERRSANRVTQLLVRPILVFLIDIERVTSDGKTISDGVKISLIGSYT